jgi:Flp pilus assembly pilin Flp
MPGRRDDGGASLVEYALLIALIALVALLSLRFFGTSRDNSLSRSASALESVVRIPPLPLP